MFAIKFGNLTLKGISNYERTFWNFATIFCNRLKLPSQKLFFRRNSINKTVRQIAQKNVVYVGGFGCIGYHACKSIAGACAKNIMILDFKGNEQLMRQLKEEHPETTFKCMELDLAADKYEIGKVIKNCAAAIGGIDILINGGGVIRDNDPKATVDINLTGVIHTAMAAIPLMSIENGGNGGLILNVASVHGLEPCSFAAIYAATKHAIIGFTRSCADPHYYKQTCIAHAAVCPGFTDTPMTESYSGVTTFDYSNTMAAEINEKVEKQSPEECGKNMLTVVQCAENGSAWVSDLNKVCPIEFHTYWEPTEK